MAKKKKLTRIEQARKDLGDRNLDELLEEISVQLIDKTDGTNIAVVLDGWYGVSNHEGLIAFFGTKEEAYGYRLDFINRILNK